MTIDIPKGIDIFGIQFFSNPNIFVNKEFTKFGTSSIGLSFFLSPPVILSTNLLITAGKKRIELKCDEYMTLNPAALNTSRI